VYIDHVVMRDKDANTAWTTASDGTLEERRYHCQNWRADVSAVVTSAGKLVEAIKNSSYGIPTGIPGGDTDSDGDWDATDSAAVTSGSYEIRKDPELDNDADAADVTFANSIKSGYQTLGRGVLSSTAVGNRKGYAGYENDIYLFKLFHVRNRVFDDVLGRWTRRDPLGYVDAMSVYAYTLGRPVVGVDPSGAASCCGSRCTAAVYYPPDSERWPGGTGPGISPRFPPSPRPPATPPAPPAQPPTEGTGLCIQAPTLRKCLACCNEQYPSNDGGLGAHCNGSCHNQFEPDDPIVTGNQCLDCNRSESDLSTCDRYPDCACLHNVNVKCMCKCMGTTPWETFVRACLQCMLHAPDFNWSQAHIACWAKAEECFPGQTPNNRLASCAATCTLYQSEHCPGPCNPPQPGDIIELPPRPGEPGHED
jgi:RHS repeat-associated protein